MAAALSMGGGGGECGLGGRAKWRRRRAAAERARKAAYERLRP
jgi:hypothetical protein